MAEKDSTRSLTGPRQLNKTFAPLKVEYNGELGQWLAPATLTSATWLPVPGAFAGWYIEDVFDLSGYNMDFLTANPVNAFTQQAGRTGITFPGGTRIILLDLITENRVDDLPALINSMIDEGSLIPSFNDSADDWGQVIFGRWREFTGISQANQTQDVFAATDDQNFGSLEPTTNDKLWIYRIATVLGIPGASGLSFSTLRIPSSRTILQINVTKEDDLPFMMRQKRSYELTNY
jgi:hypothetical protein